MFSKFNDTFINRSELASKPPQAVIDAISEDLPGDFHYVYDHDGLCRLDFPGGLVLQSANIVLTPEMRKALSEPYLLNEIETLMYNSQTKAEIRPDSDGCFSLNGERIKSEDLIKAPLKNFDASKLRFYMVPSSFPEPFKLCIGGNGYEQDLMVKRVPVNSLNVQKFQSIDDLPISICFTIDLTDEKSSFSITINVTLDKAHSVKEVVEAIHIYNAFMEGRGEIGGQLLKPTDIDNSKKIPEDTVDFWDRILVLETYLNVGFDITNGIDDEAELYIERLYRCLIDHKPYKDFTVYNSVSGKGDIENILNVEEDKSVYLEFITSETYELLGTQLVITGIHGLFNACFDKNNIFYDEKTNDYEIKIVSSKGKTMYEGVMLFMTKEEMGKFKEMEGYIEQLENADVLPIIQDYLNN